MKIDIKKIALIIAAGILALSGAFGQDGASVDGRDRGMPGHDGGMRDINEIILKNKAEGYVVSLSVNEGKGEIKGLRGSKMGEEGKTDIQGGAIEAIRLTFDADAAKAGQIARKVIDPIEIREKIAGSGPQRQDALRKIRNALAKAGLTATAEFDKNALVITIKAVK